MDTKFVFCFFLILFSLSRSSRSMSSALALRPRVPLYEEMYALKELVGIMKASGALIESALAPTLISSCRALDSSSLGSRFVSLDALAHWRVVDLALHLVPVEQFATVREVVFDAVRRRGGIVVDDEFKVLSVESRLSLSPRLIVYLG